MRSMLGLLSLMAFCACTEPERPNMTKVAKKAEQLPPAIDWNNLAMAEIPVNDEGEADLTRNFYFIIDGSGSMQHYKVSECGTSSRFESKMEGARWAIGKFLEQVPDDVNLGLFVFDKSGPRELMPLGPGRKQDFLDYIDNIDPYGQTPLAESIRQGTDALITRYKHQLGYGEYRLVVVTDGLAREIPQAALYAAKRGIPIYAIGLCVPDEHPLRTYAVSYRSARNFEDLAESLGETLAELPDFDPSSFDQ